METLPQEIMDALKAYATQHGAQWRAKLKKDWSTGRDNNPYLRRARNMVGPSGLSKINL